MSQRYMDKRVTWISRFLNITEKVGNALPHPATLFAIFALMTILFSGLAFRVGWSATHPGTGEAVTVVNLLSNDGFHRILLELVDNFTGFAPLGIVLVAMLGIGVAEGSGLIGAVIRLLVLSAPKKMLTFVLVFSGIVSNTAADVGYVLLIPLAGPDFCSDFYADGILSGAGTGGLPDRGQCDKHYFSYDELLCTDNCFCTEIR
jgi:aminobenzoyl-glutamate transport protein